jgi:type IV fimbrial biogenesis protein FimT
MNNRVHKGFTLIELLIFVLVAAILLGLAVPSFVTLTKNKRVTTNTNEFISTLALARSEALKRVSRVTVCKSSNGTSCSGTGGWEQGWVVFNDPDNDATVDSGTETVLKYVSALSTGTTLRGTTNVASYISYVSSGQTKLTNGTFQSGSIILCDDRGAGEHARNINLAVTGRTRVETTDPTDCTP